VANRFRVVRVRANGTDWTRIQDIPINIASVSSSHTEREAALSAARQARDANGWRVRVYSPNETTGDQDPSDLVWDSDVNL
jgi:hypothetical protein